MIGVTPSTNAANIVEEDFMRPVTMSDFVFIAIGTNPMKYENEDLNETKPNIHFIKQWMLELRLEKLTTELKETNETK